MFAAFRIVVPLPACVNEPVPDMGLLLKSTPCRTVLLRLTIRFPFNVKVLPAGSAPLAPPLPNCKEPLLIVVTPE